MIFGEGFTDDTFIRRLKPVKKGAVKIGFITLEELNWKKKIYIAAVGCNYSDPNQMRSDVLISTSEKICLNDYREEFEENPNKTITQLTRRIENDAGANYPCQRQGQCSFSRAHHDDYPKRDECTEF